MSDLLHILIVDDDASMANTLMDIFNAKGFAAEVAYSAAEALQKVADHPFDCILTDIKMPEMDGVQLMKKIRTESSTLPVVMMTAYSTDTLIQEGLEQGAIAVLTKPLDIEALLKFFSTLGRQRSVIIVDDDALFCATLGDILRLKGFAVTQLSDARSAVAEIQTDSQVVLLDMKWNGVTGVDLLKEIRQHHPDVTVILVTGYQQEMADDIEIALKTGAHTCLYKPLEIDVLLQLLNDVRQDELARIIDQPVMGS